MSKEYYEDFYGFTYCITKKPDGKANLSVRFPQGYLYQARTYNTYHGARIAMGKISEGTARMTGKEDQK